MQFSGNLQRVFRSISLAMALSFIGQLSYAGPIRDRIAEQRAVQPAEDMERSDSSGPLSLPAGVRVVRDLPYGNDDRQRMDIYLPRQAKAAPVIFMVHGGAWRLGDKGAQAVVENKVARWVTRGFIFISTNYRLLPGTAPAEQAQDVAMALAAAQDRAASWGGDPAKFILMGHSAGAHLVALLAASPAAAMKMGAKPWLGTVSLDSAAFDVVRIMEARHARFYDSAFGGDPAYWRAASPFHVISRSAAPLLAVCSTRRAESCAQASRFATQAASRDMKVVVLEQDLSHKDINQKLGTENGYTAAVESYMAGLDQAVMRALTSHSGGTR